MFTQRVTFTSFCTVFSRLTSLHFFIDATPITEIYTLSLHDALPILELHFYRVDEFEGELENRIFHDVRWVERTELKSYDRSEEHTSELQSQSNIVCRLLLEKKYTRSTMTIACRISCTTISLKYRCLW